MEMRREGGEIKKERRKEKERFYQDMIPTITLYHIIHSRGMSVMKADSPGSVS